MRRTLFGRSAPPEPGAAVDLDSARGPEWPDRVVLAPALAGTGQHSLNDRYERMATMYIGLGTLILIIILLILIF
jgi:hypothetical protein